MKTYKEIDGFFDYMETFDFLLSKVPTGGTFVECGAWLGKSSSYLCDNARDDINIYIVDSWLGSIDERSGPHKLATETDIYKIFLENMGDRKFNPIRALSNVAVQEFEDNSCDVIFIDMDHTYQAVRADINMWLPKVKNGGYLAGHDFAIFPGVRAAVSERFKNFTVKEGGTPEQRSGNSCWIYHKGI